MFISSSDNLGATMDLTLLNWFAKSKAPFLMEARKQAGAKGGGQENAGRGTQWRSGCRPVLACTLTQTRSLALACETARPSLPLRCRRLPAPYPIPAHPPHLRHRPPTPLPLPRPSALLAPTLSLILPRP